MVRKLLTGTLAGLCVLGAVFEIAFGIAPRLLYNPSASAPIGWYSVEPRGEYSRGDRVAGYAPDGARRLADRRGYLPFDYPLIKTVWAGPGETVCRSGQQVSVPNRPDIHALQQDSSGRDMPVWSGCLVLDPGEYFLASPDNDYGWDSRYFGVVHSGEIMGRVHYLGKSPFGGDRKE